MCNLVYYKHCQIYDLFLLNVCIEMSVECEANTGAGYTHVFNTGIYVNIGRITDKYCYVCMQALKRQFCICLVLQLVCSHTINNTYSTYIIFNPIDIGNSTCSRIISAVLSSNLGDLVLQTSLTNTYVNNRY